MDATASEAGQDTGRADANLACQATTPPSRTCDAARASSCEGHWSGTNPITSAPYCEPACGADDCCVPRDGSFVCVAREAGRCPAADLVPAARTADTYRIEWRGFRPATCEVAQETLRLGGTRRLLTMDLWTENVGSADLYLGGPRAPTLPFVQSDCRGVLETPAFARYTLEDPSGDCTVATGRLDTACIADGYEAPCAESLCSFEGARYSCAEQGLRRGFYDVQRGSSTPGLWLDVTDVPPGDYLLRITVNAEGTLAESDYDNNTLELPVQIPPDTAPAPTSAAEPCAHGESGPDRGCGLERAHEGTCTPGQRVRAGCSAACGLGSCEGDTVLRVCLPNDADACTTSEEIASNDDSRCAGGSCQDGTSECCSLVEFECPPGGAYVVWSGPWDPTVPATCNVSVAP